MFDNAAAGLEDGRPSSVRLGEVVRQLANVASVVQDTVLSVTELESEGRISAWNRS